MRWNKNDIRLGMFVTSTAGDRIGKVIRYDNETFVVEKGVLFPKDYELRYDHINDIKNGSILYLLTEESARPHGELAGEITRGTATTAATAAARTAAITDAAEAEQELRIPLMKEEIDVEKYQRESGHVKIHKAVKTEERRFSVPLRREEVVIEHVAGTNGRAATADTAFQDQMLDIPLHEEDLRVGKHAVVREEVVVKRVARSIEKEAIASLRSEDLEIEDTRERLPGPAPANGYTAPSHR
jgi:uncharacterized protein (TIGR02271 family)